MKTLNIFKSLLIVLGLAFTSCDSGTETEIQKTTEIDKDQFLLDLANIEKNLEVDMPSKGSLQKAVTSFQDFANIFPTDDKAADYLLRASDVALTLGQNEKSVKILGRIIEEYPKYINTRNF